ncbi:MAG: thioredoxin family protein [Cyclobacteriaceae bacterium]|nr:thioredoxin family protein [Cyclobacteriaceae bacterium]
MKHTVTLIFLFITFFFVQATNKKGKPDKESTGIAFFEGSWEEALDLARKENKLIFLDAYASWCGPCKSLQKKVFPAEKVGDFYNANFINVKMDMEKGEGIALAQKYGVRAYPSLFFIDHKGVLKKSALGYHNANQLIKLGQAVLN